jgi:hypothetical protein
MHPILAENIDGWLIAAAAFFGGLLASGIALFALVPAWLGHRRLTFALAAPAFAVGILATIWIGYGFLTDGVRDSDSSFSDFAAPWTMMAGPSFATSFLAVVVLALRTRRTADATSADAARGG